MASDAAHRLMDSPARGSSIAERTRSATAGGAADPVGLLRSVMARGKAPAYVKQVVELLLETKAEVAELSRRNVELMEELRLLREENALLKNKLATLETSSGATATRPRSDSEFGCAPVREDAELRRSIVLLHVPESSSSVASERVAHDHAYVVELLNFLNVECSPVSVYRMGRFAQNKPRLIKVVLPASKFQRLAVRRAPRLRFSTTQKGVYLRPSLTWEERVRRRELRATSGGLGNESSIQATQPREDCQSPAPSTNLPANRATSTPCNSSPTGNC